MDQLSTAEKAEVEGYIRTFPELKLDIAEIERSLELFASSAAMIAMVTVRITLSITPAMKSLRGTATTVIQSSPALSRMALTDA